MRRASLLPLAAMLMLGAADPPSGQPNGTEVSRVPQVSDDQATPGVRAVFNGIRAGGNQPLNMHRAVANAPELFVAYSNMAQTLRNHSHVPRAFRELVILRTLQLEGGDYEIAQHSPMALSCGITAGQIAALEHWRNGTLFDGPQRAVLAWTEAMATRAGPDNEAYAALAHSFDPREIVELTLTAGFYAASARTTKALGVAPDRAAAATYGAC